MGTEDVEIAFKLTLLNDAFRKVVRIAADTSCKGDKCKGGGKPCKFWDTTKTECIKPTILSILKDARGIPGETIESIIESGKVVEAEKPKRKYTRKAKPAL